VNRLTKHTPSLLLAAILGYQLFVPPSIGLASNGDFPKVVGIFDLGAPSADEYGYIDLTYKFDPQYHWKSGFYSSEVLVAAAAIGLNHFFSKAGFFDLRWMGLIHGALFVLAGYLLQDVLSAVSGWRRWFLWAVAIGCFGDVMYVSYLNSFYMDAAAFAFLILAVALFLRSAVWRRKSDAIGLVVCVVLLLFSKPQHAVLGVLLAPLFAFFGGSLWPRRGRMFPTAATVIVAAATVVGVRTSPFDYAAHGYYSVIFTQILPHSTNVRADLDALGLDESYGRMIGTHAYSAESGMNDPDFVREFMRRTSYGRVAWYFLTHPQDTYLALETSLGEGGRQRPPMGNFDRSAGLPASSETQTFALWSSAKRAIFYHRGTCYLSCFVLMAVLICGIATAGRKVLPGVIRAGIYVLAAMGLSEMVIASLADAVDVTRHYFIAATILDVELVILGALLMRVNLDRGFHAEAAQQQEL
jgi:hypothetical protein